MSYVSTPRRDDLTANLWIIRSQMRPAGTPEQGFFNGSRIGAEAEEFKAGSLFSLESNGLRSTRSSRLHDCYADADSKCESNQVLALRKHSESSIGILSESKSHCTH